jgi:hypothetical protein
LAAAARYSVFKVQWTAGCLVTEARQVAECHEAAEAVSPRNESAGMCAW